MVRHRPGSTTFDVREAIDLPETLAAELSEGWLLSTGESLRLDVSTAGEGRGMAIGYTTPGGNERLQARLGGVYPGGRQELEEPLSLAIQEWVEVPDHNASEELHVGVLGVKGSGRRPTLSQGAAVDPETETVASEPIPNRLADEFAAVEGELYGAVIGTPIGDVRDRRDRREDRLRNGLAGVLREAILGGETAAGDEPADASLPASVQKELTALAEADLSTAWAGSVVVAGLDPAVELGPLLERTVGPVLTDAVTVDPTEYAGRRARRLLKSVLSGEFPASIASMTQRYSVVSQHEWPLWWLVDDARLSGAAGRLLDQLPPERQPRSLPPESLLETYEGPGFTIGYPVDGNGAVRETPLSVPPDLLGRNLAIEGQSGSGKTVLGLRGFLDATAATDGLGIALDQKNGGFGRDLCRTRFARDGSLDDVFIVDMARSPLRLGILDLRRDLAAGRERETVTRERISWYLQILEALFGDGFRDVARSLDVLEHVLWAAFDEQTGAAGITQREVLELLQELLGGGELPRISDPDRRQVLASLLDLDDQGRRRVVGGAISRLSKGLGDPRIRALLDAPADPEEAVDLASLLDRDGILLIDTGGLPDRIGAAVEQAVLIELWAALQRRYVRQGPEPDLATVLVHIEETSRVASATVLPDLLAQSRSFGAGLSLSLQGAYQLRDRLEDDETYLEMLNDIGTTVISQLAFDPDRAESLADARADAGAIGSRLRHLSPGEWFVQPATPFQGPSSPGFEVVSADLPAGHPEGEEPLTPAQQIAFETEFTTREAVTAGTYGADLTDDTWRDRSADSERGAIRTGGVPTTLPVTERLPSVVEYDSSRHAIVCTDCERLYPATDDGLLEAIDCHDDVAGVDRDAIPFVEIPLKLTDEEIAASEYSFKQLLFLQATWEIQQGRIDPPHFDLLTDSFVRVREYLGLEKADVDELLDDGLISRITHPRLQYSVRIGALEELNERPRQGREFGHREGDLAESTWHRFMIQKTTRELKRHWISADDHPAERVERYHQTEDGHRHDIAVFDAAGALYAVFEIETDTNAIGTDAPADYETIRAADPETAIWIVRTRAVANTVLGALRRADGPALEASYPDATPLEDRTYPKAEGLDEISTIKHVETVVRELAAAEPRGETDE